MQKDLEKVGIGKMKIENQDWFRANFSVIKDLTADKTVQRRIWQEERTRRNKRILAHLEMMLCKYSLQYTETNSKKKKVIFHIIYHNL